MLLAGAIARSDAPLDVYGGPQNQPFMMSLWGLLGNTYGTLRELDAPEALTSVLVPALYFAFLFLCIVVLLNLLIASTPAALRTPHLSGPSSIDLAFEMRVPQ